MPRDRLLSASENYFGFQRGHEVRPKPRPRLPLLLGPTHTVLRQPVPALHSPSMLGAEARSDDKACREM